MNKILVAVYGSLRKELGNHRLLENSIYLGEFKTPAKYSLYALGGYPGLKQKGTSEVVMEVYEVTPEQANRIDQLEGYSPNRTNNDFYDKVTIETPYGDAGTYIYMPDVSQRILVESGDWREYLMSKLHVSRY